MRQDIQKLLKLIPQMKKRYENAAKRYRSLSRKAKAAVVRWEWCSDQRYAHNPFGAERFDGRRGRVLKKAPQKKAYKYRYGFSLDGRVLVAEQYTELRGQKSEEFWEYSEDRIDSTLFPHSEKNEVINVQSTFFEDGIARGSISYAVAGLAVESYEYKDDLLVCVHQTGRVHDRRSPDHKLCFLDDHLSYSDGQLVKIVRKWKGGGSKTMRVTGGSLTGSPVGGKRKPDQGVQVDLSRDAKKVEDYIVKRVRKRVSLLAAARVKMIELGFDYSNSGFVVLHFDNRANAEPDGEWTLHIEGNQLQMPHWKRAADALGEEPVHLILPDGSKRTVSATNEKFDHQAFATLIGEMLKSVLLPRSARIAFKRLGQAERCELGVEELEGNYGWPRYEDRGKENLV